MKYLLTLILVFAMAVPAMAFDAGKDIKIEGDVMVGYVFSSSSDMSFTSSGEQTINTDFVDVADSDSKWGYMMDVKLIYKDTFRPWIYLQGISGYAAENGWEMNTQTLGIGVDYLFYKTNYGSAFARIGYTNWKSSVDASVFGNLDVTAKPNTDTYMVGLGWSF